MNLLTQYRIIYINFYLSLLQLFYLVNLFNTVMRYNDYSNVTLRIIKFYLIFLKEVEVGYLIAGSLEKIFYLFLTEYKILIFDKLERIIEALVRLGSKKLLDACIRLIYK